MKRGLGLEDRQSACRWEGPVVQGFMWGGEGVMSKEPCWDGDGRGGLRACESLCSEDSTDCLLPVEPGKGQPGWWSNPVS